MRYDWSELYADVRGCEACELCKSRTNVVIGEGDPHAELLFVGEGPGREEDLSGRPFVGAAGKLLDKMLAAIDLKRSRFTLPMWLSVARRKTELLLTTKQKAVCHISVRNLR